jgi:hypothetical protein
MRPAVRFGEHEPSRVASMRASTPEQDDGHWTTSGGVVDVDQKAALVEMGVEEQQLLMAMHDVDCVVDIEHDHLGGVA